MANKAIKEEISYLVSLSAARLKILLKVKEIIFIKLLLKKKLGNHPNIIGYVAAACEENERSRKKEYLILTELCKGILEFNYNIYIQEHVDFKSIEN